jgi:hypothetical protein
MVVWLYILAMAADFALAFAFYAMLGLGRRLRTPPLLVLGAALLLTPVIVPAAEPLVRALVAVNAVLLFVKLYDVHADTNRGQRPGTLTFAVFLISPTLCRRAPDVKPCRSGRRCLFRLAGGCVGLSAATGTLVCLFLVDWGPYPWIVEHGAKAATLVAMTVFLCTLLVAAWQVCGGASGEIMRRPFLARTPADFWRRWNVPMQRFFYERVFKPANGRRAPVRAMLAVFVLSGLMHEYVFGIALGRLQGWQMVFFLVQGCAAVGTMRTKPRAWRAVPWTVATFAFNIASGVLFFAAVNGLVPFYARPLPDWWRAWFG